MVPNQEEDRLARTSSVYDKMGADYLTPGRRSTTTLFREVQQMPLRKYLQTARDNVGWHPNPNYLVVGPGPEGNTAELFGFHQHTGSEIDEINPTNITYLDISPVVLNLVRQHLKENARLSHTYNNSNTFIQAAAETLDAHIAYKSQDIILAALCDHFDQDVFFQSAMRVLKPGGALITSYPADGINRVVREKIYKIDSQYTRFNIHGAPYLVPSRLMTTDSLKQLYRVHGYQKVDTVDIISGSREISETIKDAAKLVNMNPRTTPLVVAGIGFKDV